MVSCFFFALNREKGGHQCRIRILTLLSQNAARANQPLPELKAAGEQVDSKNIKKHKNDVFRLTELIDPTVKVAAPKGVFLDIQEFIKRMQDENVDIKQLGLVGRTKEQVLQELKEMYMLK